MAEYINQLSRWINEWMNDLHMLLDGTFPQNRLDDTGLDMENIYMDNLQNHLVISLIKNVLTR